MTEKLKPTPGAWVADIEDGMCDCIKAGDEYVLYGCGCCGSPNLEERDALLIAEAGTIHHECGLSPRELLEGYRELRESIIDMTAALECDGHITDAVSTARAALAKHKEV